MSIGMIGLSLNALINKNIGKIWTTFTGNSMLWMLSGYFGVYLISGIYSENTDWLLNRLQLKLPFLLLPFSILGIPDFNKEVYHRILYAFGVLIFGFSLYSVYNYILDYEFISESYKRGKVMNTPIEHIRYSLMVVYAAVVFFYFRIENWVMKYPWEKYLQISILLFMITYIHMLAVRSGIVALYGAIFLFLFVYIISKKQFLKGALIAGSILIIAALSFTMIPTLKNKVSYSIYNIQKVQANEDLETLSDSYRVASIKAGIEIGNSSPIIGVGVGDVRDMTRAYVFKNYPELTGMIFTPQNQFILTYAALGIIGVMYFLCMISLPFIQGIKLLDVNIIGFHAIAWTSFLVEQTLEGQVGIAIYLLFSLMTIRYMIHRKSTMPLE